MEFRIADTFTDSLTRLTGDEQKAVKTTAFDLQMNPANPGMSFHKLDKARDKNFWSVRVSSDIRLIVHRTKDNFLLCYVDHHDKAYDWAERRKLEVHPNTGAAQWVEIKETVHEIIVPIYVQNETASSTQKLFANTTVATLLSYGVPSEWVSDVLEATEENLFVLVGHLPEEAGEALLELATGGIPKIKPISVTSINPFAHPDAQRRFRVMHDVEELERALDFPWDKWAVFLHPAQQQWVERTYNGPARVSGSAGTGKTIVALHRAVFLAKNNPEARVLLTTYSSILANALKIKLRRLISNTPHLAERIEIYPIDELGSRLFKVNIGTPKIIEQESLVRYLSKASSDVSGHKFSLVFLISEWEQVVDAWQLRTWEDYKDVKRLGRKTRLPEAQRAVLWNIFTRVIEEIKSNEFLTYADLFNQLTAYLTAQNKSIYDYAIIDEAQDFSVYHLRFLAALNPKNGESLFFAGDIGQRIFQQAFSWKSIGIDVRGRSRTLLINYRTSHQIRQQADRLLGPEVTDADGNIEERNNTVSLFNGPDPYIKAFDTDDQESDYVSEWLTACLEKGVAAHEIGVFVRSTDQLARARKAIEGTGKPYKLLDDTVDAIGGKIALSTMHHAKGLEFKCVAVMACDDEVIPLQSRIESVSDSSDLEEVYNSERHLLYVACTRARDQLLVTSVSPESEFLEDLRK